ncbi:hypothetical protein ABG79_02361 [Caloramator mitchellensis]|uniref:Uncharacterized protein n=1 Tax=Caloramator mitchellensis TaxID=908809 RepID=A0A0R3JQW3_CALMK|nr:hypothetical protein [Caloramator mitchellensis]KRQ85847.1 hypothetical protein ABG79_02361 [Caloramator mitchellensis]
MGLTLEERETIVLFNEKDKEAEIFTYNRALITKLKKLVKERPGEVQLKRDNGEGGFTFIVPKDWLGVRPPKKMNFSEETRRALSERAKRLVAKV